MPLTQQSDEVHPQQTAQECVACAHNEAERCTELVVALEDRLNTTLLNNASKDLVPVCAAAAAAGRRSTHVCVSNIRGSVLVETSAPMTSMPNTLAKIWDPRAQAGAVHMRASAAACAVCMWRLFAQQRAQALRGSMLAWLVVSAGLLLCYQLHVMCMLHAEASLC